MTRTDPAEAGPGAVGRTSSNDTSPVRRDRVLLHSLDLELDLPEWFDDLEAKPSKSVLDAWRWAFRRHGSRTLTATQKDIVWTLHTYARAVDQDGVLAGTAWPSQETLAKATATTMQTVGEALKAAEAAGWLVRRRKPNETSTIFLSLPVVLPAVTRKRSRRSVPTENRTSVTTENHHGPDGEPDLRHDGDEPEGNPNPTVESTCAESFSSLASPARDDVEIRFTFGAEKGTQRLVTRDQAATLLRMRHAELVEAVA